MRPGEVLAIEPQAIDFSYLTTDVMPTKLHGGGIAISVTINGPARASARDYEVGLLQEFDIHWRALRLRCLAGIQQSYSGSGEKSAAACQSASPVILKRSIRQAEKPPGSSACHRTSFTGFGGSTTMPLYAYADEDGGVCHPHSVASAST
jgi:hypothetical protein